MNALEIRQRWPEAFAAYKLWWRSLTLKGDPAHMPDLTWEAFRAGYEISRNAERDSQS